MFLTARCQDPRSVYQGKNHFLESIPAKTKVEIFEQFNVALDAKINDSDY